MHDARARRHPLHVTGANLATMAGRIGVLILAFDYVGHGFETAMGMIRRADRFARGILHGSEFVDQQERIDLKHALHGEGPVHEKAAALFKILGRQHERNLAF